MKIFSTGFECIDNSGYLYVIEINATNGKNLEILGFQIDGDSTEAVTFLIEKTIKYATKKGFKTVCYSEDDFATHQILGKKYGFKKLKERSYGIVLS